MITFNPDDFDTIEEFLDAVSEWVEEAREANRNNQPLPQPRHGGGGGP